MSLYERLFGENEETPAILGFAGLTYFKAKEAIDKIYKQN